MLLQFPFVIFFIFPLRIEIVKLRIHFNRSNANNWIEIYDASGDFMQHKLSENTRTKVEIYYVCSV